MINTNNKKLIKIINNENSISFRKFLFILNKSKKEGADYLVLSNLFKCNKNDVNKFGVFQFNTIGTKFLDAFASLKLEAKESSIKLGFGFNLSESFTQKEIRDNRDYIIAFLNYLKHLGAQVFFFENANLLPKEFVEDFFKGIKGVCVFGTSKDTSSTSLSDFELYSLGFNAIEPMYIEKIIDNYQKNKSKSNLEKVKTIIDYDGHYFKNYYRIFKRYNITKLKEILNQNNNFEISYSTFS